MTTSSFALFQKMRCSIQSWRAQRQRQAAVIGVYLAVDRAWLYHPDVSSSGKPQISSYLIQDNNWQQLFEQISLDYPNSQLAMVLSGSWYQLVTVDKPEVAEDNLHNTLLWTVKEMVSLPAQHLYIDYFAHSAQRDKKISVAILDKRELKALVTQAMTAELSILGISIEELATCHSQHLSEQVNLVISQYAGQDLLFTVIHQGQLCMQRRVRGFSELYLMNHELLGLGSIDNLSLELQRSMDYFESQLRLPPVQHIQLLLDGDHQLLIDALKQNFNQSISALSNQGVGAQFAQYAYQEWCPENSSARSEEGHHENTH